MKKYIYLLLFAFNSLCCAQNFTYFNKKLQLPNTNLVLAATLPLSDGYLVLGNYINLEERVVFIAKLDMYGELTWIHSLEDSPNLGTGGGSATGNCLIQIDDNHFAATYGIYKDTTFQDIDIALVKFTIEGEIVWKKIYPSIWQEQAYHLLHTKDKGFLLSGYQETDHFHFYTMKTDSEGELEWEETYSMDWTSVIVYAHETLDGGYIFSGYGESNITRYDMYVVKTNDKGKLEWEKNYGTEKRDIGCKVVPLNTGEYILTGGIQEDFIDKSYFAKLDANGNIIWEKKYPHWDFFLIQTNILIQPDNGFIGVGVFQNEFGRSQPKIIEFNHEGDTLWTKPITADPNTTVYIRDIERIENGYVLAGFQNSFAPQYGWILTMDEDGNICSEGRTYAEPDFEGCDSTVVVTDIPHFDINNPYSIQFTPNPANLQTTIHYQIPKDGVLKVYDYQGKELETYPLIANERKFLLKVTDWTSGLYFYKVSIEGKEVDSGKLLID